MITFELKEKKEVETKDKVSTSYKLIPIENQYKDYITISIKGDLSDDVMERLHIGTEVGDAATFEIKGTSTKGKLPSSEKGKGK